jgi:replication-associated recombination protein RarA
MNTEYKYRPKTIGEFVFATPQLERQIRRYTNGHSTTPLILYGKHGTGKSLLANLIPKAIDGDKVIVSRVNAEDLNHADDVRREFSRTSIFDSIFYPPDGQKNHYTIVNELNDITKAKGALRDCLDLMRDSGMQLCIFTTNELEKLDIGLRSRAESVEVVAAPPDVFFERAQHILHSEGVDVANDNLMEVLQAVYESDCDNRAYYRALDKIIDAWNEATNPQPQVQA